MPLTFVIASDFYIIKYHSWWKMSSILSKKIKQIPGKALLREDAQYISRQNFTGHFRGQAGMPLHSQ
jgi:hypothetical protein